ncbi:capsule assembly Wzi family protein [Pedobacter sp. KBS0701]|uniref:capsule assembly Wzi family protein n=1 Tax=Pedobacter sp. KBS0701 TaxID=2578106 RepID=UPI00110E572E|nr:capsule assembly Wzi family protein [Pedobacter sp. KBS0701]QDW26910.1 capsule assembly Wzi family protein [Pedobacter sp. KBS0701]
MKKIFVLAVLAFSAICSWGQSTPNVNIPYDYQFYQKFNQQIYSQDNKFHSSIKGIYSDGVETAGSYDSLMKIGMDTLNKGSWVHRKLFNEHLLEFNGEDYKVYADFLPDFQVGRDFSGKRNTWLNTRGFQVGGSVGKQFSFYLNGFENQGKFVDYVNRYIVANQVVPGQGSGKLGTDTQDWSYVTALLSYTPNTHLNFSLGYDKNFIGDGYRSMLLSDVSSNYSFFRVRATLGAVQYQTIFAYMLDPGAPKLTDDRRLGDRGKWMAAHYVDWNVTKKFSLGFFQAVTWADAEVEGKRGFDFNYVHPFIFLRPVESTNTTSPDKMRLGFNLKYEVLKNTALYGQFMFDEFTAKEFFAGNGYWANKYAVQLGLRGSDLFKVKRLNYLAEFNTARPYTYAHFDRLSNYSNYNQPLAHPFGANFREFLGILNYSYKRFDLQGEALYSRYGKDPDGQNYGGDIFKSYDTRSVQYGSKVGQGIKTNLYFARAQVSYLLNPKYNLRLELAGTFRRESSTTVENSNLLTFGIRSSFRNIYHDF